MPLTDGPGCDMIAVLGRIFPALFSFPRQTRHKKHRTRTQARPHVFYSFSDNCHPATVCLRALPGNEMTPDECRGSFLFLGFNHWVTSLSVESTGFVDRSPFRGKSSSSASFVFRIYVKRKMLNPAYRCTFHVWCHLFYDNSLSRRKHFYKTEFPTNSSVLNGIKGRMCNFSPRYD